MWLGIRQADVSLLQSKSRANLTRRTKQPLECWLQGMAKRASLESLPM